MFTAIAYPIEFEISNRVTFSHFTKDLQGWGAPWYQVFIYTRNILNLLTLPTVIALCCTLPRLFRERNIHLCLLYAWGFGVFPPFLVATTKIPCATLIGAPALLLLLGDFIARTTHRKENSEARWRGRLRKCWTVLILLLFLCETIDAWWATRPDKSHLSFFEIATYVKTKLPQNAVLLTEENNDDPEHNNLQMMFLTSHTAYPYYSENAWRKLAKRIRHRGGIPYILTFRELNLPVIFKSGTDGVTIYSTSPT